jgi:hypothetical protein
MKYQISAKSLSAGHTCGKITNILPHDIMIRIKSTIYFTGQVNHNF